MEHAWLDSLSEDWVSQPGSDTSAPQLPPLKDADRSKPHLHEPPSRIPRRTGAHQSMQPGAGDTSISVLSERSANENNIPRQQMSPSKLSQEIKASRSGAVGRSVSASTNGSVVHNTVQHGTSPSKANGQTPEWKRRLVHGDVQYGEQRDLFCSAAAGLQDMFKPPPTVQKHVEVDEYSQQHETTMPSSPPIYRRASSVDLEKEVDAMEEEEAEFAADVTPSPSPRRPREVNYKLNLDDDVPASSPLGSVAVRRDVASDSRGDEIYRDESCLSALPRDESYRKVSGQTDTMNEDFSPILIGRHSDEDGRVDFAPIEVPVDQLRQKLERLRINQMLLDSQADPEAGFDGPDEHGPVNVDNTEDYAQNGGFLNLQRGGRSADGSFRYRGLSPGLGGDTSEMLPEESLQASTPKQFPTIRTEGTNPWQTAPSLGSPSMPRAPFPSPEKRQTRGASGQSGGSPLKLFGPYDTFTNQTLLRRISQLEEGMSENSSRQSLGRGEGKASPSHANEAFVAASSPSKPQGRYEESFASSRSASRFGAGDLEGYQFAGDVSNATNEPDSGEDKENLSPAAPPWPTPALSALPTRESSPDEESELMVRRRRHQHPTSSASKHNRVGSMSSQLRKSINPATGATEANETPKRDAGSEGKRPRTSPSKDPTPKRRRTLHRSDIAYGREEQLNAVETAHQLFHSVMSKKRKDARPGGFELADPDVLAMRPILRPRTPTPTRRKSSRQHGQHAHDEAGQPTDGRPKKSPVRAVQNEYAAPSSDAPTEGERKPSIRTQDFVDQAAQIMAMIRNQVRAPGLASLEESEAENGAGMDGQEEGSYQESTNEPFSRPPSREVKAMPRSTQQQEDPELVNRLKQYQELSDMGDVISSSMRSVGLAKEAIRAAQEVERQINEKSRSRADEPLVTDGDVVSDLSNVRISTNPAQDLKAGEEGREFLSNSSGQSNHTFPSTSSRGSDSRRVIMPETVSHLIPDRVGSMYLDKQNNIWIKKKDTQSPEKPPEVPPSEDSEDDPFASIPDLSVDMTRELQNLRTATARKQNAADDATQGKSPASPSRESKKQPRGFVTLSPNGQLSPEMGTLAREEFEKLDIRGAASPRSDEGAEAERELGTHEEKTSNPTSTTRRRNLTISFSSPVASIIQDVAAEDLDSLEDDVGAQDDDESVSTSPCRSPEQGPIKSALKNAGQAQSLGTNRVASRHLSVRDPAFVPRPVSRIDEQDEDSTVEITPEDDRQLSLIGETSVLSHKTPGRRASLSFLVNRTPGNGALSVQGDESAMIGQNVGRLSLSPLSEFTLNNSDQSFGLEVSYVMGHRHMATGDGSRKVMSMTIRELVDKLGEVEPFEPYWEDMTELDLHDKRLSSLHMLDEFCGKVVTLDASNNTLGHLDGVPTSVRQLKVSQNILTELTSWDHLANLQYVDISGNEVKSLSALKNLVHLRSIKADDNQLASLDGLDCHDGLLSLRARNNLIESVDFAGVKLERLTELDLGGNMVSLVENLEMAPALANLKLSRNRLLTLAVKNPNKTLRRLEVSDNELMSLDICNLPALRTLHADRNYISSLSGFGSARQLDSLSLREQRGKDPLDLSFLATAYEIRKLFLSGNYLGTFEPRVDFLNLQLLELANCGLRGLPQNMGQLTPNLRTLNLNFNAVSDLSALRFVPRMKKLLAAGNRLRDSTAVTRLLTEFPHLRQLDLRDNPVTLGFYAPVQVLVPTDGAGVADPFALPPADVKRDELFASRLDQATRMRRRLHQIVFVASCKRLRSLDGLSVSRREVLAKDSLLDMLVAEGLLPRLDGTAPEEIPGEEPARAASMGSRETEYAEMGPTGSRR